ncbi:TPA: hypothetical protein DEG21_03290 [Patescibacteria group bacterium]|nr:hypothetical protein [Candidatus Gracilibacteria bacterium]
MIFLFLQSTQLFSILNQYFIFELIIKPCLHFSIFQVIVLELIFLFSYSEKACINVSCNLHS